MRIDPPSIYLITAGELTAGNFDARAHALIELIQTAVDAAVPLIQIREKQLTARRVYELTAEAVLIARGSATRVLVNDRADIAAAAGADGVHLTSSSLPVEVVRRAFGSKLFAAVSTHSVEDVQLAADQGADFAVFGPVFQSPGKSSPFGIKGLRAACTVNPQFPVFALGGIDETNYAEAVKAGAAGVAGIRAFNDVATLERISRRLTV